MSRVNEVWRPILVCDRCSTTRYLGMRWRPGDRCPLACGGRLERPEGEEP